MSDESFSRFLGFINDQLDLSGLGDAAPLSDERIEQAMTLIRGDIEAETLRIVDDLLCGEGQPRLAPFHREIRRCLARALARRLAARFPDHLGDEEWLDAVSFVITVAWLVRRQMDGDPLS